MMVPHALRSFRRFCLNWSSMQQFHLVISMWATLAPFCRPSQHHQNRFASTGAMQISQNSLNSQWTPMRQFLIQHGHPNRNSLGVTDSALSSSIVCCLKLSLASYDMLFYVFLKFRWQLMQEWPKYSRRQLYQEGEQTDLFFLIFRLLLANLSFRSSS